MSADSIVEIPDALAVNLREILRENARTAPTHHATRILQKIPVPSGKLGLCPLVRAQLALARKHVPYEEIHRRTGHPDSLSPHASVALSKIASVFPKMSGAADALVALESGQDRSSEWTDRVDNDFRVIVPDRIFARKFIARAPEMSGALLEKTEYAEARHQRILREVAAYLAQMGMRPQESGSIDLAVKTNAGMLVAEIKSATKENFLSQGSKGFFQILSYAIALRNAGWERVAEALIIEGKGTDSDVRQLSQVGEKCGVRVFLYNESESWPNRVKGLMDLLSAPAWD